MGLLRHNCSDTVYPGVYGNREFPRRDSLSSRVLSWRLWEPESCQNVIVVASVGTRIVRHRVSVLLSAKTQSDVCGRCTFQDIIVLSLELKEFTTVGFRSRWKHGWELVRVYHHMSVGRLSVRYILYELMSWELLSFQDITVTESMGTIWVCHYGIVNREVLGVRKENCARDQV